MREPAMSETPSPPDRRPPARRTGRCTARRSSASGTTPAAAALPALLLALAAAAGPAAAQPGPIESPVKIEFNAQGGVLTPAASLTEGLVTAPPSSDPSLNPLELSDAFALGGGAGLQLPAGFGVEGQLLFSPGVDLRTVDSGTVLSDADFLAVTGHVVYRLPIPILKPFVGAGGGVRRLSFDDPSVLETDGATDATASLLAGAYLSLIPGWTVRVEARDYISGFEDPRVDDTKLQNDLAFMAGLSWSFP